MISPLRLSSQVLTMYLHIGGTPSVWQQFKSSSTLQSYLFLPNDATGMGFICLHQPYLLLCLSTACVCVCVWMGDCRHCQPDSGSMHKPAVTHCSRPAARWWLWPVERLGQTFWLYSLSRVQSYFEYLHMRDVESLWLYCDSNLHSACIVSRYVSFERIPD